MNVRYIYILSSPVDSQNKYNIKLSHCAPPPFLPFWQDVGVLNRPIRPSRQDITHGVGLLYISHPHDGQEISCPVTNDTQVLSRPQECVAPADLQVFPGDGGHLLPLLPPGHAGLIALPPQVTAGHIPWDVQHTVLHPDGHPGLFQGAGGQVILRLPDVHLV